MNDIPLVFHFVGNSLPKYAFASLRNAAREWPGQVILLHDRSLSVRVDGVEVVHPARWYDPGPYATWAGSTSMERDFRNGFWFHAVERFFMLEQWARSFRAEKFLHCELDVAICNSSAIVEVLDGLPRKLVYPRASSTHAGANWLFCASIDAMERLTQFLVSRAGNQFEMALLAQFLDEFPDYAESAPSHHTLELATESRSTTELSKLEHWGGIVDVHPIGTWLLGRDPRSTKTFLNYSRHYYDGIGSDIMSRLSYGYDQSRGCVTVRLPGVGIFPVFALHVHSKKMQRAYRPSYLKFMVLCSKFPFPVPVSAGNFRVALVRLLKRLSDPFYRVLRRP